MFNRDEIVGNADPEVTNQMAAAAESALVQSGKARRFFFERIDPYTRVNLVIELARLLKEWPSSVDGWYSYGAISEQQLDKIFSSDRVTPGGFHYAQWTKRRGQIVLNSDQADYLMYRFGTVGIELSMNAFRHEFGHRVMTVLHWSEGGEDILLAELARQLDCDLADLDQTVNCPEVQRKLKEQFNDPYEEDAFYNGEEVIAHSFAESQRTHPRQGVVDLDQLIIVTRDYWQTGNTMRLGQHYEGSIAKHFARSRELISATAS